MKGPVVLLGPPGAGKSTAGRAAARILGTRFIDLDDVVAAGHGDVASIFSSEGEASFRARELVALEAVLDGSDVVIAPGAGIVDTAPARALLTSRATCVRLDVDRSACLARLASSPVVRPWLPSHRGRALLRDDELNELDELDDATSADGDIDAVGTNAGATDAGTTDAGATDARATDAGVTDAGAFELRERPRRAHRAALAAGRAAVDANRTVDDVARALAASVAQVKPIVPAALAPEVVFDERLSFPEDAVVVAEAGVVRDHGVAAHVVLPGGEREKTLAHVEDIARELLRAGLSRGGLVVAVGGGAHLDAVGLACALVLRGVRWWAVPTTLLAQADAGVGGKTAVNLDGKKNLLGAFHPPEQTVIARRFRSTLRDVDVRAGRAEMLKHEMLAADAPADGSALIHDDDVARSLSIKLSVVRRDPRERGLRAVLNLGHTLAHALEATSDIGHGEAVRHGLLAMLALSVTEAGLDAAVATALAARVRGLGPMTAPSADPAAIHAALAADKKAGRFVVLEAPGLPRVVTPPPAAVARAIEAALAPGR